MRVLWVAPNGGLYKKKRIKGTGGWIGSLQQGVLKFLPEVEIGITFKSNDIDPIVDSTASYFPINYHNGRRFDKIFKHLFCCEKRREEIIVKKYLTVIDIFKPDVVHIWGLEDPSHAMLVPMLNIPCVVHIQGLTSFILHTYCPPYFSSRDLKIADRVSFRAFLDKIKGRGVYSIYSNYRFRAEMELEFGRFVNNWIGRTEWDRTASQFLSPNSNYYYCDELVRDDFVNHQWQYHYDGVLNIQSNLSTDWYKGVDVVLRTAKILKGVEYKFVWNIYGVDQGDTVVMYMKRKYHIDPDKVNIYFHGKVSANIICESLLTSDVYVHTSYIENSSNAVAEAMQLGMPIIVQNVGGLSSLLANDSGLLVPPNEPYVLAAGIMKMNNRETAEGYSQRALKASRRRGDMEKTTRNLFNIYKEVMK